MNAVNDLKTPEIATDAVACATVGEEAMVKASRGRGDSPARAAKRKPPRLAKRRKG